MIRAELHTYLGNNTATDALLAGCSTYEKREQAKRVAREPRLPVEKALLPYRLLADPVWKSSWTRYKRLQLAWKKKYDTV